jgi:hypothetical protein
VCVHRDNHTCVYVNICIHIVRFRKNIRPPLCISLQGLLNLGTGLAGFTVWLGLFSLLEYTLMKVVQYDMNCDTCAHECCLVHPSSLNKCRRWYVSQV